MNEMLKKMVAHEDYEVAYLGEVVSQNLDEYLSCLEALGYSPAQAEAGVSAFAKHLMEEADQGRDLPACDYFEDVVGLMAGFCRAGKVAA